MYNPIQWMFVRYYNFEHTAFFRYIPRQFHQHTRFCTFRTIPCALFHYFIVLQPFQYLLIITSQLSANNWHFNNLDAWTERLKFQTLNSHIQRRLHIRWISTEILSASLFQPLSLDNNVICHQHYHQTFLFVTSILSLFPIIVAIKL